MRLELFSIGPLTVYSYGLMIAIGVIAAIWLAEYEAKRENVAEDGFMTTLGVICVVGGFLGAKLLFLITILPQIIENPSIIKEELSNGFVVYGGLIGGILTGYVYCKIKGVEFWKALDIAVPVIALAQFFGRIGCFFAGCCYGQPTESICGIEFPASPYTPPGKLFPIQLVSSGLNLLNFLFLYILWRKGCMKKGAVGACYVITYSIGRFILEYFRGDLERGSVGALSTSQFISIFTLIVGILMLIYRYKVKDVQKKPED